MPRPNSGSPRTGPTSRAGPRPTRQVSWIRDLVEILDTADSPEELLEHTRMAMYQDRIFAFTPKGELIQLPKGATPIDFAYAVHTDLGDQAVGAKINGRVVPLRTVIENGDQVQILRSKAQEPQAGVAELRDHRQGARRDPPPSAPQGARRADRARAASSTTRSSRACPRRSAAMRSTHALKRLKLPDEAALMEAIARRTLSDARGDGGADAGLGRRRRRRRSRRSRARSRSRG